MNAAEHDKVGLGPAGCLPGKLEGIACEVRELDDIVPLVMVPEDQQPLSETLFGFPDTASIWSCVVPK